MPRCPPWPSQISTSRKPEESATAAPSSTRVTTGSRPAPSAVEGSVPLITGATENAALNPAAAYALHIAVGPWDLAVIVPLSFILQMAPISINGFGVREAVFSLYFARLRLPLESALLVSLVPTLLVMLFSLSGAAVYVGRRR